ncbi:cobaltochelatase subunit CobN [Ectothiorhodospira sp. PHS-1]|uniref:cobaltochelatase subunit CobN n=1 Tax=Ectothiorhodospira sp. PHS-1 TaxID=519989 RepID=UPI00024A8B35|nr:cobaltochelatase subunit CobN [Ectothiorhodospira sp. PHS-1]EHQ52568.1 cobaltochelatase subunit CobN [Ectothiorhodospira sp. PHS-1]
MHLLSAQPGGFVDDDTVTIRLDQSPAEIVILSAADTTLALLASHYPGNPQTPGGGLTGYPSLRLANLLHLRQPASVDLYMESVLERARLIIIDHLGGESYWPYGTEQVQALCRRRGIDLAMFSGDHVEDPRLLAGSTVAPEVCRTLWRYLREGGGANVRAFYRYLGATFFQLPLSVPPPRPLPAIGIFHPELDVGTVAAWEARWIPGAPRVALLFYRAHLQAGNIQVFDALCGSLLACGLNPLPLALISLKDPLCLDTVRRLCREQAVTLVLNSTAFARGGMESVADTPLLDDVPVVQILLSGGNEAAWESDPHGLQPRDIAMQVALPEMDGHIISRAVSFKGLQHRCPHTQSDVVHYQPQPERIRFVAELARRWCRLRTLDNGDKRLALILANYPTREGRLGNGVGLDTPQSVIVILERLQQEGYRLGPIPENGDALMALLRRGITNDPDRWPARTAWQSLSMPDYEAFFDDLPEACRAAVLSRWGAPDQDPMVRRGRFMIAGLRCGHVFIGIQPPRGYHLDMMANYHDPDLVPPHYYLAFHAWLRRRFDCDAVVHVGKHGNLEWLPGKSVALSRTCWPDLILGPMPHLYPFIVNDPGEGTQAKRRAQAVIIDHLMPPLTRAENYGPTRDLERLVDEYYEALMLDRQRAGVLRRRILEMILAQNLHQDLGLEAPRCEADEQRLLNRTDAYLCELKESQIRDGLHVFGRSPTGRQALDTLLALARYPSGDGQGGNDSLIRALSRDLLGEGFDPLDAPWEAPWQGLRPPLLVGISDAPWRHQGDTRERLECLALQILSQGLPVDEGGWSATRPVLERIHQRLRPALEACGPQELLQLTRGLAGRFVPPGPSGAPSRGRPDVLPTGRNFYSVDVRAVPTPTSWMLGLKSANLLVERYLQEEGDYPRAVGLSVWGTATMRTGGDDIAQAMALIGVRPRWAAGSHRVTDFEILPMSALDRPRIDVTLRISGFFRDAFTNVIRLFDAAVQAVAGLDEPEAVNPIRARILRETRAGVARGLDPDTARRRAGLRIFGARPGAYGAGLQGLMESRQWRDDGDLSEAYVNWGSHAYGTRDQGTALPDVFRQRLTGIDLVVQNQDNREHDLLDSDDYYQFQGGMSAAVRHLSGRQPALFFGDHSNPQAPRVQSLAQEISRVIRARVTNPKWIQAMQRHGYKGAAEMAATVDYLFAYDATARVVRDDQYARVTDALINDSHNRAFLEQHNPDALHEMCERLLEAMQRGLWQAPGDYREQLETRLLESEARWEGA